MEKTMSECFHCIKLCNPYKGIGCITLNSNNINIKFVKEINNMSNGYWNGQWDYHLNYYFGGGNGNQGGNGWDNGGQGSNGNGHGHNCEHGSVVHMTKHCGDMTTNPPSSSVSEPGVLGLLMVGAITMIIGKKLKYR